MCGKQKADNTRGCQRVPNVNIPETEKVKLVWTYQEKRRRQPLKINDGHGCTGEEKNMNSSVTESPFAQLLRTLNLKIHAFLPGKTTLL